MTIRHCFPWIHNWFKYNHSNNRICVRCHRRETWWTGVGWVGEELFLGPPD